MAVSNYLNPRNATLAAAATAGLGVGTYIFLTQGQQPNVADQIGYISTNLNSTMLQCANSFASNTFNLQSAVQTVEDVVTKIFPEFCSQNLTDLAAQYPALQSYQNMMTRRAEKFCKNGFFPDQIDMIEDMSYKTLVADSIQATVEELLNQ